MEIQVTPTTAPQLSGAFNPIYHTILRKMEDIENIDWSEVAEMIEEELAAVNGPYTSGKRVILETETEDGKKIQVQIVVTRDEDDFA